MKCRGHDPDYSRDLANSMKFRSRINFEKRVCFLIPIAWEETQKSEQGYQGTSFESVPTFKQIDKCHF